MDSQNRKGSLESAFELDSANSVNRHKGLLIRF